MINTYAMDALGQWELVAEELAFLARYQRDDGKITHEISQAAAHIDWFDTYPYAYYHADTTPHWMYALYLYWLASGDDDLLRELWPAYRRAWAWCLSAETDGDGIIENTVGGLGAVEVGGLGEALHQDIYLAGVWVGGAGGDARDGRSAWTTRSWLDAATRIAPVARRDAQQRVLARGRRTPRLRDPRGRRHQRQPDRVARHRRRLRPLRRGAGPRHPVPDRRRPRVVGLGRAHALDREPLYHPLQYNMGTVWPFVTGFASWAQYRYRRPWAGFHLMDAIKQMTFDWSLGRHGELFSGDFYQPLDQTVPHQFFATSMLVTPLLRGVFGWEPDAPRGRARLAPQMPPDWPEAAVRGLRAGATTLDVEVRREWGAGGGEQRVVIRSEGPTLELEFVPDVPAGAAAARAAVNGTATEWEGGEAGRAGEPAGPAPLVLRVTAGRATEITVAWEGGLAVAPPRIDLEPGQRSTGPRIIDLEADGHGWLLTIEGTCGARIRPCVVRDRGGRGGGGGGGRGGGGGERRPAGGVLQGRRPGDGAGAVDSVGIAETRT